MRAAAVSACPKRLDRAPGKRLSKRVELLRVFDADLPIKVEQDVVCAVVGADEVPELSAKPHFVREIEEGLWVRVVIGRQGAIRVVGNTPPDVDIGVPSNA